MTTQKTRWTGHGDARHWTDAANWHQGVPAAGIDALFDSGGAVTTSLSPTSKTVIAGALIVQTDALTLAHGTLMLAPAPAKSGNTFDMVLSDNAEVTVAANARVLGHNVAEIGAGGSAGTLTVLGLVGEEYGIVSAGLLTISGPAGHWLGGDSGVDLGDGARLMIDSGGTLDAGKGTFKKAASTLQIGDNTGDASAIVTGAGSTLREAGVVLGQGYGSGTLTISDGAVVEDNYGSAGALADGAITVTGAGSTWYNNDNLSIGGQVPVSSGLTITDGGSVRFGRYGFDLYGTLSLDATATLTGNVLVSGGGVISALAGGSGTVTLGQKLDLFYNDTAPYTTETTYLESASDTSLVLAGAISGSSMETLDAASGTVVLDHAGNSYGSTSIYAATLEIAAAGAAGAGPISFMGGGHPAALTLDTGIALPNLIDGFAPADTIDLRGLAYGDISKSWAPDAGGGTLTLGNGSAQVVLIFGGNLSADSFTTAPDGHGGTNLLHT